MKRLIRRPLLAVTMLAAAAILAGTYVSLSFGQARVGGASPRPSVGTSEIGTSSSVTSSRNVLAERPAAEDAETRAAIEAYRQTQDEDEKARIVKALPGLVGKQFDARQEIRERELKQLEEQLRKLQELHARRGKQRDQIIEERVRQLLREADGLGWGSDDERPANLSANRFRSGPAATSAP